MELLKSKISELEEKIRVLQAEKSKFTAKAEDYFLLKEKAEESEKRLKEAEKMAHLGHWELDIKINKIICSDEVFRIFEIEPKDFGGTYEAYLNEIHPEDRVKVNEAYKISIKNKLPFEINHRILLKSGKLKYVLEKCQTFYDQSDKPIRSIGTILYITKRKQRDQALLESQMRYRQMFETNQAVKLIIDPMDGRIVEANNAAVQFYGYNYQALTKMCISEINILTEREIKREMQKALEKKQLYFNFQHRLASGKFGM